MKTAEKKLTAIGGESPTNGAESGIAMKMPYRVEVTIEGVCPILFHAWNVESIQDRADAPKGSEIKKTDDVESYVHRNEKEEISVPGTYLVGSIINAAKFQQDPRSPRKSAMDLFKAAIVSLTPLASLGAKDWDYLDKRRVALNRSGITRSRPAMREGWSAKFILMCNLPEYIGQELLNDTIQKAGKLIGLADYRPSFGRFIVTRFVVLKD